MRTRQSVFAGWVLIVGLVGCGSDKELGPAPEPVTRTVFSFPAYSLAISHGHPFGIVSLKLADQRADFAHRELPLGDWEWFWLNKPAEQTAPEDTFRVKLIDPEWPPPVVEQQGERTVVRFSREDVLNPGITLEVEFSLDDEQPEFDLHYTIHNRSKGALSAPYVMVGLPGFSNHGRIWAVGNGLQIRLPLAPYDNFLEEAIASGKSDYLLMRRDASAPSSGAEALSGSISIAECGRRFTLTAAHRLEGGFTHAYAAHTNRPDYLTSHLYLYLEDIPAGGSRKISVHYSLAEAPDVAVQHMDMELVGYHLGFFASEPEGAVLGARGGSLYRILDEGHSLEKLHEFIEPVQGIHVMQSGAVFVSTDADRWDPEKPCRIYRSVDQGATFELVKTIRAGCALWWSMADDRQGNLYLGEYGPRGRGQSKRVWKTEDYGATWRVVFTAPDSEGVHIHRVAVDPYTDFLWVTHGDREFQGTYLSTDRGETWTKVRDAQPTSVVFTEDAIFWGEDTYRGMVTRYDRKTQQFETVLDASSLGPYGGSVYDMAISAAGLIYVPMVKYAEQSHKPTLWIGDGRTWNLLRVIETGAGEYGGFAQISRPDPSGYVYVEGYKMRPVCR